MENTFVTDPVCQKAVEPAGAAASEVFEGERVYFCSEFCRYRFLADPAAYLPRLSRRTIAPPPPASTRKASRLLNAALMVLAGAGAIAGLIVFGFHSLF